MFYSMQSRQGDQGSKGCWTFLIYWSQASGKNDLSMKQKMLCIGTGILLLTGWWYGSAFAAELKIGCVDIQRAVNECNAGKEARKAIIKEVQKLQLLAAEKQKEVQALKESLDKQNPLLEPEARATKEREFQNKLREFQRWGEDNQNEINQKRMELERTIATGLLKVIRKIGEDEGYVLILGKNENIVPFGSKSIDLTDRVIKAYDLQRKYDEKNWTMGENDEKQLF
jgi:outer membrane protein